MDRRASTLLLAGLVLSIGCAPSSPAPAKTVAFLGVQFLNDHESLEPTTPAERSRLASAGDAFKAKLDASGLYAFTPVPTDVQAKIDNGPVIGSCSGCEFGYGQQLGTQFVAWLVVQKVSNLILNINVYWRCLIEETDAGA